MGRGWEGKSCEVDEEGPEVEDNKLIVGSKSIGSSPITLVIFKTIINAHTWWTVG
jgi:hypothetical protein